jgi:HupE / UreJ protein
MKNIKNILKLTLTTFLVVCLSDSNILAHDVVKDLANISKTEAAVFYLRLGFKHIIPLGFDHILFIISLFLLSPNLKLLMWQSAAFTIGHCFTLGFASYGLFKISPSLVEPLIAASIIYVAAENLFTSKFKTTRLVLVFAFGLLHGLGFASALNDIGLPQNAFLLSLLMFNVGVELAQLSIILMAFYLAKYYLMLRPVKWQRIVNPISVLIIIISTYWFVERIV